MRRAPSRGLGAQALVVVLAGAVGAIVALTGAAPVPGAGAGVSDDARPPSLEGTRPPEPGRVDVLAHRDAEGMLDVVVVVGQPPGGDPDDATVLLVPPSTLVEVPARGTRTIAELGAEDESLAVTVLGNALGITLDEVVVLDDHALASAVAPAGEVRVDLRRPVRVRDVLGTLALARGEHRVPASDAVRLLTSASVEGGELDRLVTVAAVVAGWREALRDDDVAWAAMAVDPRLAGWVVGAARAATPVTLPVDAVPSAGAQRFSVRRAELRALVEERFGWARLGRVGGRPRVELLNGAGAVGVTPAVAARVVAAGGEVTLTGNVAGFGVATSRVLHYRSEDAEVARELAEALGGLPSVLAAQPLNVVDVTVVIGADWMPEPP